MNKSYTIKEIYSGMRIDRWIRNNVASLPQSLIEKSLRKGKIKVNIKKVNSSYKLKTGDKIKFFNFNFEVNKNKETNKKFSPSSKLLKVHENRILENNDDFIGHTPRSVPRQWQKTEKPRESAVGVHYHMCTCARRPKSTHTYR